MATEVLKTKDYDQFSYITGNRPLMELHVRRLIASFEKEYLFSPILVNSKNQVIDGQHRLEAAKRLSLPVYYIKCNGYGLAEVQKLNTNNKTWTKKDYLQSYCDLGLESYLRMAEFMKYYPAFGIGTSELILTNNSTYEQPGVTKVDGVWNRKVRPFEAGLLKINDLPLAYENAAKISQYSRFFNEYFRREFVRVMLQLFKNKNFDHDTMIKKLEIFPTSLVPCQTVEAYKLLIEKIYNYKNRQKVNLRY